MYLARKNNDRGDIASIKGITRELTVGRSSLRRKLTAARKRGDAGGYHIGTLPYARYLRSGLGREKLSSMYCAIASLYQMSPWKVSRCGSKESLGFSLMKRPRIYMAARKAL
jgi:hypothetical protein